MTLLLTDGALLQTTSPAPGVPLPVPEPSHAMLERLARRRSTVAKNLIGPGPNEAELDRLLVLAGRVPDHGKLGPWRFLVIAGDARHRLGTVLANAFQERQPDAAPSSIDLERARFTRAPVVVGVVAAPVPSAKIPEWEQLLSVGAVCHQLLLAAHAAGFAAQWLTEWYAYDRQVLAALGLVGGERMAGFIYIGHAGVAPEERSRAPSPPRITHL